MNDILGLEGLVPSSLVLCEYPSVRTLTESVEPKLTLASRPKLAMATRREMAGHIARMKVNRALKDAVLPAADRDFEPGDQVLVWREKHVNHQNGE